MNWRDETRGPTAEELRRKAREHTNADERRRPRERGEPGRLSPGTQPLLTPDDRQRIRAARDTHVRERELTQGPDGKWRLPGAGRGTR